MITSEEVERAFQRVDTLPPESIESLVGRMSREQPYLQTYVLAVGGDILNDDERETMNFLGIVIWQAFAMSGAHVHQVSGEDIEQAENANLAMLKYLDGEATTEFTEVAQGIVNNTEQPALVTFVVETLMEVPQPDAQFREESTGLVFIYLKTVIDCLNEASH